MIQRKKIYEQQKQGRHCYLSPNPNFFSAAKIKSYFQSRQIFSARYSTRLYKYIDIYNRYSAIRLLNCPAMIMSQCWILQILSEVAPMFTLQVLSESPFDGRNMLIIPQIYGLNTTFGGL